MPNIFLPISFSEKSKYIQSLTRFLSYALCLVNPGANFLYIGTANNDSFFDIAFFKSFMKVRFNQYCNYSILDSKITDKNVLQQIIEKQAIIFVGGGNTLNMLAIWETNGLSEILRELAEQNKLPIMMGVSAGGMFPFESGLTDSDKTCYMPLKCLGFLKGSFCPHLDSQEKRPYKNNEDVLTSAVLREEAFKTSAKDQDLQYPCYGLPDDCMMLFVNGELKNTYSIVANKKIICYQSPTEIEDLHTTILTAGNIKAELLHVNCEIKQTAEPTFHCSIL